MYHNLLKLLHGSMIAYAHMHAHTHTQTYCPTFLRPLPPLSDACCVYGPTSLRSQSYKQSHPQQPSNHSEVSASFRSLDFLMSTIGNGPLRQENEIIMNIHHLIH